MPKFKRHENAICQESQDQADELDKLRRELANRQQLIGNRLPISELELTKENPLESNTLRCYPLSGVGFKKTLHCRPQNGHTF